MESEISSMGNSGSSNRDAPTPLSFTSAVDSAIRSSTALNLAASPVHKFASRVDNAIKSSSQGEDLETSHFPVHGFASRVDYAIKSSSSRGADLETSYSPVRDFASRVDYAIKSSGGGADLETSHSPVHGFASGVDNVMSNATGHVEGCQLFTLAELVAATNNFSLDNKIGIGSFGVVYRGKLADGREVAIKRGETGSKMKKFKEKESAFESVFAFLSRLHHKHLVGLAGFCKEKGRKLLVSEYMKNGALYDHLHDKNNVEKGSSVLNSWKMRINIALDASRGIEYLHKYVVPYINTDIKSSKILLDDTWTAKVSHFGSLTKAAGTVGYIDPESYGLINVLIAKSDVYGLGVVLLELLTGKTAIFNSGEDGGTPLSVVDFAVPAIWAGDLLKILDPRVGPLDVNEAEAVELVAFTAIGCVYWKGKDKPTMADIVVNLERALAICHSSHDSISSHTIPVLAICDSTHDTISSGTTPVVLHTKRKKKNLCCFTIG